MNIGIDFDNTVVCYDGLFYEIALKENLIPKNIGISKKSVKDYLISSDREMEWTELQGKVYGEFMYKAKPFEGILDFFSHPKISKLNLYIISHRTLFPYVGKKTNLHNTARTWLRKNHFFEKSHFDPANLFFEITLAGKLERIKNQRCDIFIDDLASFLLNENFPEDIRRILFDPERINQNTDLLEVANSWNQLTDLILFEEY